jgi:gliding motility-associated-like protein
MAKAQLFYNGGADVAVTGGGILYVDGAVENAQGGLFSNAGQTWVKGYFRNGQLATGGNAAGEYIVYGDWENNDVFTADQSIVRLTGNTQHITGTSVTTFHDLSLESTNALKIQTLDANVNHLLNLNDCELATQDYRMTVTNPVSASIARSNGFVSSTGPGRLVRYTNSTNNYLFPTGWNDQGNVLYRPAEIKPSVSIPQSFECRMGFGDASNEGYDVSIKAPDVTDINTKFWHLLKQVGGTSPSGLSIYYNQAQDGVFSSIGRWESMPRWEDIHDTYLTPGNPLSRRTKDLWQDNGREPHVLINTQEIKYLWNWPNVFNPNSTEPGNNVFQIVNHGEMVTLQSLIIYNRWGEPVFDSERDGKDYWDGTYFGKLQPMGNYVFVASVKVNATGQVKQDGGNLSLLW